MPYLFTSSLKVAIPFRGPRHRRRAADRCGGRARRAPARRLLYGQTVQIWSALFMAAGLAVRVLVLVVGMLHAMVLKRLGRGHDALIGALVFWLFAWALNEWLGRLRPASRGLKRLIDIAGR